MHVTRATGACPNCGNHTNEGFHIPACGGLVYCEKCCIECRFQEAYPKTAGTAGIAPYLGECGATREDHPVTFLQPAPAEITEEEPDNMVPVLS